MKLLGLSLNVHTTKNRVGIQTQKIFDTESASRGLHSAPSIVQSIENPVKQTADVNDSKENEGRQDTMQYKSWSKTSQLEHNISKSSKQEKKCFWWFLEKIYSLIILLLICCTVLWISAAFALSDHPFDFEVLPLAITFIWAAPSALLSAIFYRLGFTDWLSTMNSLLEVYHVQATQMDLNCEELFQRLKRRIRVVTAIQLVLSGIITVVTFVTNSLFPADFMTFIVPTRMKEFYISYLWFVVRLGLCFSFTSWVNIMIIMTLLMYILRQHFRFLSRVLTAQLSQDEDGFYCLVRSYRQMYQTLAKIVHVADKNLQLIFGIYCLVFILSSIFGFFALVKVSNSVVTVCPTLIVCLVQFGVTMFQACLLQEQVCACFLFIIIIFIQPLDKVKS